MPLRFVIVAFLLSVNAVAAEQSRSVELLLKWKHQFQFAGFYMAKEKGWYDKAGLDVSFKEVSGSTDVIADVAAGKSDFGISDSVLIYRWLGGARVKALMAVLQDSPIAFITLAKSNISTLQDLQNRKVELARQSIHNTSLLAMLKANDISIKHSPRDFSVAPLIRGDVDVISGYLSNEPFTLRDKGYQTNTIRPKDYGFDFYGDILFTSQQMADQNPKTVDSFYEASKKGWEYALTHPEEAVEVIMQKYNTQNKTKDMLAYEAHIIKKLSGFDKGMFGRLDQSKLDSIKKTYALLFPGRFANTAAVSQIIYHKALPKNEPVLSPAQKQYLKQNKEVPVCLEDNLNLIGAKDNTITGILGDLYAHIGRNLGVRFVAVEKQDSECVIEGARVCPQEDESDQNQSVPLLKDYFALITSLDKSFVSDHKELVNKQLLVHKPEYKTFLKKHYPFLSIKVSQNRDKAFEAVLKGRAFGYLALNELADRLLQKYGFGKLKISGFAARQNPIAFCAKSSGGNELLPAAMNSALKAMPPSKVEGIKHDWRISRYTKETDYRLVFLLLGIFGLIMVLLLSWLWMKQRHNKRLQHLLNASIEGISVFEKQRLTEVNSQLLLMLGYDKLEQIKDSHISAFTHMSEQQLQQKMQCTQKPCEMQLVKQDGTTFAALVRISAISGSKKIISVIDISRLKEAQNELAELNANLEQKVKDQVERNKQQQLLMLQQSRLAQMGELLSMIAHQWRQPINTVAILNQVIVSRYKKNTLDDTMMQKFEKDSKEQIAYMSATIDDFKTFFTPQKHKERFDLNKVINTSLSMLAPVLYSQKITVTTSLEKEVFLEGYPNEAGQVIINIITNAKDAFTEQETEDKKIDISLSQKEGSIILCIEDNAGGIDAAILDKIFDPYFSTKADKNGTGLGLYMSRLIVTEHMNGRLQAKNSTKGARFVIEFLS
ncbi:MAG: ABC transporter substrate-binding protein [Campylobacterota bacterium]